MRDGISPAGEVAHRLGLKLDPDDLRIISLLYFGGVCSAERVRTSVDLSRLTFFLRIRRLTRAGVISGGMDAVDGDLHNLNLTVSTRCRLFALEAEIRAGGLFGGHMTGEGTGTRARRLSL